MQEQFLLADYEGEGAGLQDRLYYLDRKIVELECVLERQHLVGRELHALNVRTFTPEEWQAKATQ